MRYLFLLLVAFLYCNSTFSQCDGRYNQAIFTEYNTETYNFGENTTYDGRLQSLDLDLYSPKTDTVTDRPCIVFCFGGAFVQGTRTSPELVFMAGYLAQRGFVCASIDYRLDNQSNLTAKGDSAESGAAIRAVQDAKAAIRFLKSKHSDFGIDTNLMFIGGTSAGGVTALTLGYSQYHEFPSSVKTLVDNLGGYEGTTNNLPNTSTVKGLFNFAGGIFDTAHIGTNDLPVYLNHATGDAVVPFYSGLPLNGQAKVIVYGSGTIEARMKSQGNYYEIDSFNSTNHPSFVDPNPLTSFSLVQTTTGKLRKFLYEVIGCNNISSQIAQSSQKSFVSSIQSERIHFIDNINLSDVFIYNLIGKQMKFEVLNSSVIDFSTFANGIYVLRYQNESFKFSKN